MIAVSNNKLSIPEDERNIGCKGDSNVATRIFVVSNLLLSALTFRLDLSKADGTTDTCLLTKTVTATTIDLLWNILASNTNVNGALKVQLRAFDSNALDPDNEREIWHSEMGQFIVKDSINAPGAIPSPLPSAFTEMEQRIEEYVSSVEADLQTIATDKQTISAAMDVITEAAEEIATDKQTIAGNMSTIQQAMTAIASDKQVVASDRTVAVGAANTAVGAKTAAETARDEAIAARDFAVNLYLWQSAPLISEADNSDVLLAPHMPPT